MMISEVICFDMDKLLEQMAAVGPTEAKKLTAAELLQMGCDLSFV